MKKLVLLVLAFFSISFACAWLDPPSDTDKQYFKDSLKNMSEKEFSGIGAALGNMDVQVSVYIYKHQTLLPEEWNTVFKDAFATNPSTWTEVYDYVLNRINQSNYYETFGYLHVNNKTYWVTDVSFDNSSLSGDLTFENAGAGTITMNPLFWSFWSGSADIDNTNYRLVMLKLRD